VVLALTVPIETRTRPYVSLGVRLPKKQGNEEKKQNGSPVGELF